MVGKRGTARPGWVMMNGAEVRHGGKPPPVLTTGGGPVLEILGLSQGAELVYSELVSRGDADVAETAHGLGTPDAAEVLAELERKGLIAPLPGAPGRYGVAPPAVALEALLARQRHALHQAELSAAALVEAYRSGTASAASRDLVEVVTGAVAIRHRFEQLQRGAASELLALVTGRTEVVAGDETGAETDAVARGVAYRVVIERSALGAPGAASVVGFALSRDQRVRVAERVPTKLIAADRACAMVPLTSSAALVVRAPGLLRVLLSLFESVWDSAQPVRLEPDGGAAVSPADPAASEPDPQDLRVLSLLLIGSTDAAIANQLGVGLRTVQRRIRHLMEAAGVETRIQLGWQARDRGWISG